MSQDTSPPRETLAQISALTNSIRTNCNTKNTTLCLKWRMSQLQALKKCLVDNKETLCMALKDDLKQTKFLAEYEIHATICECQYMIDNLHKLASPKALSVPAAFAPAYARLIPEPFGLILIVAPWNYPVQLSLFPLIGAIASGNAVVLKPSETSSATSAWLHENLHKCLDTEFINVVLGSKSVVQSLLQQKWDYIFYTGNQKFAKIISATAAQSLTPVTTELGGRNPTVVDETVNLYVTVKRIIWAKFTNCGQTCVAPNHVYVPKSMLNSFLSACSNVIREFYTSNPRLSPEYSRIVSRSQMDRLVPVIQESKETIFLGGDYDIDDLYISPTIVVNPSSNSLIMSEEIFGPVLPIISYEDPDEPFQEIRTYRPLAIYVFSRDEKLIEKYTRFTSSGSICINEALSQAAMRGIPFGGVGESGHGRYYGKYSFSLFSHKKPMIRRYQVPDIQARFPPYSATQIKMFKVFLNYSIPHTSKILTTAVCILFAILLLLLKL